MEENERTNETPKQTKQNKTKQNKTNKQTCNNKTNEMNMSQSQLDRNLSNFEVARKKGFSGLQRDSNPWPLCSRCCALP